MRGGTLRRVLLRLAAGVAGGALGLEHLPPKILPAQQSPWDLFLTGDTKKKKKRVGKKKERKNWIVYGILKKKKYTKQTFNLSCSARWLEKRGGMEAGLNIDGAIWTCCEVDTHCSGVWGGLLEM